jgi:hypothetical protein
MEFLVDPNNMLVFRTYWPIFAILVSLLVYIYKRYYLERSHLREMLRWELYNNIASIFVNFPKGSLSETIEEDPDHIHKSAQLLANATRNFSKDIYEKYITSTNVLNGKEKRNVLFVYMLFQKLSVLGAEISELLKVEKRSELQKNSLSWRIAAILQATELGIPYFRESLIRFGFDQKMIDEVLDKNRGIGIEKLLSTETVVKPKNA